MDRKLRSDTEVAPGNKGPDAKTNTQEIETAGPPAPKRSRPDEVTDGSHSEVGAEGEESDRPGGDAVTKVTDDGCTCPICDFVAKTPTALKIHSKRKHSRRGGGRPGVQTAAKKPEPPPDPAPEDGHLHEAQSNEGGQGRGPESGLDLRSGAVEVEQAGETGSTTGELTTTDKPALPEDQDMETGGSETEDSAVAKDQPARQPQSPTLPRRLSKRAPKPKHPHSCSYCGHEFKDRPSLEVHIKRRHTKEKDYSCQLCRYACAAKCDYEKHCLSNKHRKRVEENSPAKVTSPPAGLPGDEDITEDEQAEVQSSSTKTTSTLTPTPASPQTQTQALTQIQTQTQTQAQAQVQTLTQVQAQPRGSKRTLGSRFQLQCSSCEFRVSNVTLLESHTRLKHPAEDRLHCRLCRYYCATPEWMDTHLASEGHQRQVRERDPAAATSPPEECVARVSRDKAGEGALTDDVALAEAGEEAGGGAALSEMDAEAEEAVEAAKAVLEEVEENMDDSKPPKRRRGRPKLTSSTTCSYCGLAVSNATNLSVHVRRKHSHQYSFACRLCNYNCVTRGDMDRHRVTKKHTKRVAEAGGEDQTLTVVSGCQSTGEGKGDGEGEVVGAREGEGKGDSEGEGKGASEGEGKGAREGEDGGAREGEGEVEGEKEGERDGEDNAVPGKKKSKYDAVNSCPHCDFVAHSIPSLDLHVKRKHTREFEFVCLACSYYAVTCREMSRHASTDKHKQKSQMYLEQEKSAMTQEEPGALEGEAAPEPDPHPDEVTSTTTLVEDSSPSSNQPQPQPQPQPEPEPQPQPQPTETPSEHVSPSASRPGTPSEEMTDRMAEEGETEVDGINVVVVCVGSEGGTSTDDVTEPIQQDVEPPEGSGGASVEEAAEAPVSQPSPDTGPHQPQEQSGPEAPGQVQAERKAQAQAACSDVDMDASEDKDDVLSTDKQLVRAVPFDACIVSIKSLSENQRALHERLASEGEAAGGGLAGAAAGGPPRGRRSRLLPGGANGARRRAVTPNPRIRCEDCGFLADGLSGLNVHISMKHPSREKRFHCLLCGKSFYTESNLHQHLTSGAHLRNEQNSIEELPEGGASFKCVKCTDPFETEQELFRHIKEKHEELLREVNKYVLEDTEQINREREENQGSVCKHCGKVCKSSNSMAFLAHVRTHTGSKPFKCKICNFATAQLGDARNHVKRHLGMREYKCHICG
ncbi:zinc finger protein 407 [Osmerus mordax]|uniref:zinc finger protein 407 n=1 Tax=Osmerus mordax TaxID=8014 RepID=UPI00350F9C27